MNLNAALSFNQRFSVPFPQPFPISGRTLISPYWENFETVRGFGNASYRNTTDPTLLRRTQLYLRDIFPSARDFSPSYLVIATWDNVPTTGVTTDSDLVRLCKKPVTDLGLYTCHIDTLKTQRCHEQAYNTHKLKVLHSYILQTEQRVPEVWMLFCLRNVTYLLRQSCLTLEINEFRCYEAPASQSLGVEPRTPLVLEAQTRGLLGSTPGDCWLFSLSSIFGS